MNELRLTITQLLTLKDELKTLEIELKRKQELLKNSCHHPEEVQKRRRPMGETVIVKTCDICGYDEHIV